VAAMDQTGLTWLINNAVAPTMLLRQGIMACVQAEEGHF